MGSSLELSISQGVRQGCPISPFLFAIATQPFMEYLNARIANQSLHGIRINRILTISYRFFADDLGQFIPMTKNCFDEALAAINTYTLASGSQLNLDKSVIIPFNIKPLPDWIGNIGCRILKPKEIHKYLGTPLGQDIDSRQLHSFVIEKVKGRINSWSAKTLSFSGKILLIRHILQAIPIYYLMSMPIPARTAKLVASILKDFLWGFNETGGRKNPLEAWKKICEPRQIGGLGVKIIPAHSKALLSKWILASLKLPDFEWTTLFYENLTKVT